MASVVLDASAILAFLHREPGAMTVERALVERECWVSAINQSEVFARLMAGGLTEQETSTAWSALACEVVDFDESQAWLAALLRPRTAALGLSLGDRACLALAMRQDVPVLTADRIWAELRGGPPIELAR